MNMALDGNQVFEIIKQIASDQEHRDDVAVLPLMCGTGKSTAISYMIRHIIEQVEETGNGLLIVTDRKDRMSDYMHPHDEDLARFLEENQRFVTMMTHETVEDAYARQNFTPVLMMTTQRYFRLSETEINNFLRWEKGPRPLILIDEKPELKTIVELDERNISDCISAIRVSNPQHYDWSFGVRTAKEKFDNFVSRLKNELSDQESIYCFWLWYKREEMAMYQGTFDVGFREITRRRSTINTFGGGDYYEDIYTRIRAIHLMESEKALLCHRKNRRNGLFIDELNIMLDNYSLVKNVNAKVIILDGTAELTPEYSINPYNFQRIPDAQRQLNHLTIKLIDIPTSKTKLQSSKDYRRYVSDCVGLYYSEKIAPFVDNDEQWAVFTYATFENELSKLFPDSRIEHFGNIKGKNDFRKAKHILQVGLNRFPDEIYYLYFLAYHPEQIAQYENMNDAFNEFDAEDDTNPGITHTVSLMDSEKIVSQSESIKLQMTDYSGQTKAIMNNLLLAEIEQNLFRGIIRNSDSEEEFTFHLFVNTQAYRDLIRLMISRYGALGATIQQEELPVKTALRKIINRSGQTQSKQLIEWHDTILRVGDEYTPELIRSALGMNGEDAVRQYEKMLYRNKVFRILMEQERKMIDDKIIKGHYVKIANWAE